MWGVKAPSSLANPVAWHVPEGAICLSAGFVSGHANIVETGCVEMGQSLALTQDGEPCGDDAKRLKGAVGAGARNATFHIR